MQDNLNSAESFKNQDSESSKESISANFIQQRMHDSITRVSKTVFPESTNHYDTLFGGTALKWMDESAFICATRFTRKKVLTISTDRIDFKKAIPAGTIVDIVSQVTSVGRTSLRIRTKIYVEEMFNDTKELAVEGDMVFVAVDDHKKSTPIFS